MPDGTDAPASAPVLIAPGPAGMSMATDLVIDRLPVNVFDIPAVAENGIGPLISASTTYVPISPPVSEK